MKIVQRHKERVEKKGYNYLFTYERREKLIDSNEIIGVDVDVKNKITFIRIKCPYCGKEYDVRANRFLNSKDKTKCCCHSYENSFAYHIEVELNENLDKYWSDKNTLNPYYISKRTHSKIWIKCTETDYHNDYMTTGDGFVAGSRCPQCSNHHGNVHPRDSFGALHPEYIKYWSPNNKKSPYEITPRSHIKIKFICEKCGREFERKIIDMVRHDTGSVCKECNSSKGETRILRWLNKNNIFYIHDEHYFKDLIGVNDFILRPDFILPNERIWIEYDGIQHDEWNSSWMSLDAFKTTQANDKIKDEYAKDNNWNLIRIKDKDYDNIEDILNKIINKGE